MGSQGGRARDEAIALVDAASVWGWIVVSPCFMYSVIRGAGVGGGPFVGLASDKGLFRGQRIVNTRATKYESALPLRCWMS